jgi:hypothetical protein
VPLSRPEESECLRFEFAGRNAAGADGFACHDIGVILGRANKAACAGGSGSRSGASAARTAARDDPRFLYNFAVPEIRSTNPPNVDNPTGHSASFSYDGETIIFGHKRAAAPRRAARRTASRSRTCGGPLCGTSHRSDAGAPTGGRPHEAGRR